MQGIFNQQMPMILLNNEHYYVILIKKTDPF